MMVFSSMIHLNLAIEILVAELSPGTKKKNTMMSVSVKVAWIGK